ncbi:hypothetical protein ID1076_08500 [Helicobacter pylori]
MIALSDALLYMAAPRQVAKKLTFKEGSLKFQIKSFKHKQHNTQNLVRFGKIVTTN